MKDEKLSNSTRHSIIYLRSQAERHQWPRLYEIARVMEELHQELIDWQAAYDRLKVATETNEEEMKILKQATVVLHEQTQELSKDAAEWRAKYKQEHKLRQQRST